MKNGDFPWLLNNQMVPRAQKEQPSGLGELNI